MIKDSTNSPSAEHEDSKLKSLNQVIASRSLASQKRIGVMANKINQETRQQMLHKELKGS